MTQQFFEEYAKSVIAKDIKIESKDVYMVWFNYTLGNAKGLFSFNSEKAYQTNNQNMPDYVEVTFNNDKEVFYFDWYTKERQIRIFPFITK